MDRQVTTQINQLQCSGCGACVNVCPSGVLKIIEGRAAVTGKESMGCGHCAAVCPLSAITVGANTIDFNYSTFRSQDRWLPHGEFDPALLDRLLRSRRSCRNFTSGKINPALLDDLVLMGISAPSGTNSQQWTFTIVPERNDMIVLGNHIADFFTTLNRKAENPCLRLLSKLFFKDRLGHYYRTHYQSIQSGLNEWRHNEIDRLFHGASAAIIVGSGAKASCPHDDALLASQNILLGAHSLGLGSCMIGFAVHGINNSARIKSLLNISETEIVYSCIALGYPQEKYQSLIRRRPPVVRRVCLQKESVSPPGMNSLHQGPDRTG